MPTTFRPGRRERSKAQVAQTTLVKECPLRKGSGQSVGYLSKKSLTEESGKFHFEGYAHY